MNRSDESSGSRRSAPLGLRPQNALEFAFRQLDEYRASQQWVQDRLHAAFTRWNWPGAQRGLVTELVCGVVRRQATLDVLLQKVLSRPLDSLEPSLQTLLSLGAYQLAFLDDVPDYAAVNEVVELTKSLGYHRWTKIANGVLRSIGRLCTEERSDQPAFDALPLTGGYYRRLTEAVFPDPAADLAVYVASAFSLPLWLTQRWCQRMSPEEVCAVAMASNTAPQTYLRVNRRRTSPTALMEKLQAAGVKVEPIADHPDALRLISGPAIPQIPGFTAGEFTPQDLTAMRAAPRLSPGAGDRVWDVCAAPGTKTTHLAELMDDHGEIIATDVDFERLTRIDENAKRLGLSSIRGKFVKTDGTLLPEGPFDAILLDVPCSNTGVLHRRPEARWRLEPRDIIDLVEQQANLLAVSWMRLRPGGRLLYSTCSIEPEENEERIMRFLALHPEARLLEAAVFRPSAQGDGGYQALLQHFVQ
ncbi:MAG TPA: 16S rRNA (cytosine(967)-C(5))-methyltransferase RsmB [Planctomycetaceae bacterium]|nr:16S rRNA (cytosine(967)-C(5))-methyltransferase RsmB [Planctomycetaceae bacterium]